MEKKEKPSGDALRLYITENIDRAVAEDWIRVYYQPVMRSLTGEICGMEALARWEDPAYGLLAPDEFITALEEKRLIHKLDACIIQKICRDYSAAMAADHPAVPISFNLSRLDFSLCDIHEIIETAIRENKVPRNALRVEITESMMESEETHMQEVIDRFWERGLRVWMDDFGSGYSSLNVLKDYHFDTLKIDMIFLNNFNIRSQEIIKSVVDMSKRIGVHTLAEGVETAEQLAFLKNIGCEKAQGYFIGKPMPLDACLIHLREKGLSLEAPAKRQYYHDIGRVNILSATPFQSVADNETEQLFREGQIPLALVEHSGGRIRYLFANRNYVTTLLRLGVRSTQAIEEEFADGATALRERFLALLLQAKASGDIQTTDFLRGNNHCYAQVRWIAGYPDGDAYLCILQNLSENRLIAKSAMLADHLQSLCNIFERIELVDLNTGESENLYHTGQTRREYNRYPAQEELRLYAREEIYPEDKNRFDSFADLSTMEKRIQDSDTHYISMPFRTRITDGTYSWTLYAFLFAGDPSERKILSCYRRLNADSFRYMRGMANASAASDTDAVFTPELLWQNFSLNSDTAFFWKDKKRRFVGANRKFLDYYGFASAEPIIGKNDEEIGWHVDPDPYKADEERVLANGEQTFLIPGACIRQGEIRNIMASKFPIYRDGEIVGLMGYFLDITEWQEQGRQIDQLSRIDALTGSMSLLGIVEAILRYQDSFVFKNADFALLLFDINHFHLFGQNYGREWCNHLLLEISRRIRGVVGTQGVFGRMNGDHFLIVRQFAEQKELEELTAAVIRQVEEIREIDGIPCTIYLLTGWAAYSETKNLQQMLMQAQERLQIVKNDRNA